MDDEPQTLPQKGLTSASGTELLRILAWLSGGIIILWVIAVASGLFVPVGGGFWAVFFSLIMLLFLTLTGLQLIHAILDFRARRFDRGVGGLTHTAAMAAPIGLAILYLGAIG